MITVIIVSYPSKSLVLLYYIRYEKYIFTEGSLGTGGMGIQPVCNAGRILPVLSHKLEHETLGLRGNPSIGDVSPRVGGKLLLYT